MANGRTSTGCAHCSLSKANDSSRGAPNSSVPPGIQTSPGAGPLPPAGASGASLEGRGGGYPCVCRE